MMLGHGKENYRIRFELVVQQINVTCSDITKTQDNSRTCIHLVFNGAGGKDEIQTECVSSSKRTSPTDLIYELAWKHQQILKFSVTLNKRKGRYERPKKPPELYVCQENGSAPYKLGSVKLTEIHEIANKKISGQSLFEDEKLFVALKNNKRLLSCELIVQYHIADAEPSIVDMDSSSKVSSALTPSASVETINSVERMQCHKSLKQPLNKLLEEVALISVDGHIHSAEWSKMHLCFLVFGSIPDFMGGLRDLISQLQGDHVIGRYVEVVHVCQAELAAEDVLYPYLPHNDPANAHLHDLFEIPRPYQDHPKIYVVNRKMTEYFVVESYQIEKYLEERNARELYSIWNNKKLSPPRSKSHQDELRTSGDGGSNMRSNSYDDNTSLPLSNDSLPSNSSFYKAMKVSESPEYLALKEELNRAGSNAERLSAQVVAYQMEMEKRETETQDVIAELKLKKELVEHTQEMLALCQRENLFLRYQVTLRGNLAIRSGTFNLYKSRWFELENHGVGSIVPVISFFAGSDRLGQIVVSEIQSSDLVNDTQFRLSTQFATYMLNAESGECSRKWLSGIAVLQKAFPEDSPHSPLPTAVISAKDADWRSCTPIAQRGTPIPLG